MEIKTKLKISASFLSVVALIFLFPLLYTAIVGKPPFCVAESCVMWGIMWLFLSPVLLLGIIFTVYYYLKNKQRKINDKKITIISGIIFLLAALAHGSLELYYSYTNPTLGNTPGSLLFFVIYATCGPIALIFFIKNLLSRK